LTADVADLPGGGLDGSPDAPREFHRAKRLEGVWAVLSAIIAMSGLGDIQIGGSTYARDQAVLLDVATRRSTLQAVP
jgi:hypothetical protein